MAFISWEQKYSVNVSKIDQQHKMLVDLVNELHEAMRAGKSKEVMSTVIKKLVDYTVTHFSTEEGLMAKYGYPGLAGHKTEHKKFVDQVSQFQNDFNEGKCVLSVQIMNFLKDWLVKHILGTDKKLGEFLSEKGVK